MPLGYIAKRLFHLSLIMFGVSVLVFLMLRMIPGDPARLLLGEFATPEDLVRLQTQMGLDQSYPVQYGIYLKNLLQGDLGKSLRNGAPVASEIGARLPATLELAVAAMLIASLLGIAAGVVSAARQYSVFDYGSMFMALVGVSMPIFWLGLMLIYLLLGDVPDHAHDGPDRHGQRTRRGHRPDAGGHPAAGDFGDFRRLRCTTWCCPLSRWPPMPMAIVARITRSAMLEVLNKDYVRTARAKGMSEGRGHSAPRPAQRLPAGRHRAGAEPGAACWAARC